MPYIQKTFKNRAVCELRYFTKLTDALDFGKNWEQIDFKNEVVTVSKRGFKIINENLKI